MFLRWKIMDFIISRCWSSPNDVQCLSISSKTIDSILKVSNAFSGWQNLDKKNGLLVVDVIISFLLELRSLKRTRNAKIQIFAISSLLRTNSYLTLKLLVKWDSSTIWMYHLRYTQEFQNIFSDETFVFLKKSSMVRNTEEGHLAYSYPERPCISFDVFARRW